MIVCTQCGFQNLDDDTFCGSCGGFLEWTGERSAPPQEVAEDPPAPAPKRSFLSRVQTVLSLDVHAPGDGADQPEDGGDAATSGPPSRPGGGPPSGPPGGPPSRPGGGPPARPPGGGPSGPPGGPPARPGGGPPSRPPGGGPPARPGGGPPSGPPGGPPARPGGGPPSGPPGGGPPARPGGGPPSGPPGGPPSGPPGGGPAPGPTRADAAGLVAPGATAPRSVARTTVPDSEASSSSSATVSPTTPSSRATDTTAVKPGAPISRNRPTRQPPSRKLLPGDLICGECGEGNPPARNFCRRCGATLRDASVVKRRWWQRLVPRRRAKSLEAGNRPWKSSDGGQRQRRRGGRLGKVYAKARPIAAAALLLAGLVVGFSPNLRERVTGKIGDTKDSVMAWIRPSYVPLSPISISATTEQLDQPASNVIDGNTLSYWVAPASDREPVLLVRFDEPFDLERLKVWNGSAEGFKDRERARDLHFVFDNGKSHDLEIKDLPSGEEYEIDAGDGVTEIEIHVTGTYSSLTSDDLGLSEIEFYFRR